MSPLQWLNILLDYVCSIVCLFVHMYTTFISTVSVLLWAATLIAGWREVISITGGERKKQNHFKKKGRNWNIKERNSTWKEVFILDLIPLSEALVCAKAQAQQTAHLAQSICLHRPQLTSMKFDLAFRQFNSKILIPFHFQNLTGVLWPHKPPIKVHSFRCL